METSEQKMDKRILSTIDAHDVEVKLIGLILWANFPRKSENADIVSWPRDEQERFVQKWKDRHELRTMQDLLDQFGRCFKGYVFDAEALDRKLVIAENGRDKALRRLDEYERENNDKSQ